METLIVPAVIAKKQSELDEMLDKIKGKVKRVQLDIMDGEFVPNMSLDFDFELPSGFEYEAHLMLQKPLARAHDACVLTTYKLRQSQKVTSHVPIQVNP